MLALKPVKLLLTIRLMTPDTASEPQAADAPAVTTSTRWISEAGMIDRSTPPVMIGDTTRWPSNKIRLRFAPRLRRLTPETPSAPELEALPLVPFSGVGEAPMDGIWRGVW